MKKFTSWGKLIVWGFVLAWMSACQSTLMPEDETDAGLFLKSASNEKQSYIVQLEDAGLLADLKAIESYQNRKEAVKGKALGILKKNEIADAELGFVYSNSIVGFSVRMAPGQLKKLQADGSIKSVNKDDVIVLAPPSAKVKPGDSAPSQVIPWGVTRVGGAGNGAGKRAWIIDSGVDLEHKDLNVDVTYGFSAFSKGKDASFDDNNGHGSHVAGTIAAINNNTGVVGVAAGATVVPVKVLNLQGSGSYSGVIAGVDWVASHGTAGDVANMSLGGPVSTDLDAAVVAAAASGVKFVLAAGNEADDANNHSPARANGVNIYTISAMDKNDSFASFSNYGNPPVDYCAPGVSITSTYKDGGYATLSGTSMAAPHVAGLLLLGPVKTDGYVGNDTDGNADPIAHR